MSYVKNIFNPITRKSAGYTVWFALITWLMSKVQEVGLYDNSQGSRCDYESWADGQIYQWILDGQPCAYTAEFLIGYIYFLIMSADRLSVLIRLFAGGLRKFVYGFPYIWVACYF